MGKKKNNNNNNQRKWRFFFAHILLLIPIRINIYKALFIYLFIVKLVRGYIINHSHGIINDISYCFPLRESYIAPNHRLKDLKLIYQSHENKHFIYLLKIIKAFIFLST